MKMSASPYVKCSIIINYTCSVEYCCVAVHFCLLLTEVVSRFIGSFIRKLRILGFEMENKSYYRLPNTQNSAETLKFHGNRQIPQPSVKFHGRGKLWLLFILVLSSVAWFVLLR